MDRVQEYERHRENLPLCLKRKAFNQCILPVLTYGSETWSLTMRQANKLRVVQRKMERQMLGITLRDRKTSQWIRQQTRITDLIEYAKRSKWRWAGHIARCQDDTYLPYCRILSYFAVFFGPLYDFRILIQFCTISCGSIFKIIIIIYLWHP